MNDNSYKHQGNKPVERHNTAAWAEVEKQKPVSKVTIPSTDEVDNAKEYVDGNEK